MMAHDAPDLLALAEEYNIDSVMLTVDRRRGTVGMRVRTRLWREAARSPIIAQDKMWSIADWTLNKIGQLALVKIVFDQVDAFRSAGMVSRDSR